MRDVPNGQITHRDKSLTGFSICCRRNSICLRLDMFATQTRDLSHIELERSNNISSLSAAKAYRVNEVDISTEEKIKNPPAKYGRMIFLRRLNYLSFFSSFFVFFFMKMKRKTIAATIITTDTIITTISVLLLFFFVSVPGVCSFVD